MVIPRYRVVWITAAVLTALNALAAPHQSVAADSPPSHAALRKQQEASQAARPPQQPPLFRSRADLLTIDVHVVDAAGNPVAGLRPEDFTIRVDGQPRRPALAELVTYGVVEGNQPGAQPAGESVPTAAATPRSPATNRTILLVVDEGNIRAGYARLAAEAAKRFLASLSPADRVGLVTIPELSTRVEVGTDRVPLLAGLDRITGHRTRLETQISQTRSLSLSEAFASLHDPRRWNKAITRECVEKEYDFLAKAEGGSDLAKKECRAELQSLAQMMTADVRQRTVNSARSLTAVMEALANVGGPKTLVLVSEELPVADYLSERNDFKAETSRIGAAAARAQASVYILQLHTPDFDVDNRVELVEDTLNTPDSDIRSFGLEAVTTLTGGQRLMVSGRADTAFQRIARETSAYYLLGFEPLPADRDGKPHAVTVSANRGGLQVRARREFMLREVQAEHADAATAAPPARPAQAPAGDSVTPTTDAPTPRPPAEPPSPSVAPGMAPDATTGTPVSARPASDVRDVVERAGGYVVQYGHDLSLVIGVEHYTQWMNSSDYTMPVTRSLVSEFALVRIPDDWLGFRDISEVDGTPVHDRQDRLQNLLLDGSKSGFDQGRKLSDESARHNLGAIQRNFNVPTTALFFLHPKNQPRFEYKKDGEETVDGVRVWKVKYREKKTPTIIRTSAGRDMPLSGTFWVDPVHGRVLKTHMELSSSTRITADAEVRPGVDAVETRNGWVSTGKPNLRRDLNSQRVRSTASITVLYKQDPRLGLLLPAEMRETYEGAWAHPVSLNEALVKINCVATYGSFKRFETSGRVVQ